MNNRHIQVILDGCQKTTEDSNSYNVKIIGENGQTTYVAGCVLVFIAPWLSDTLNERVINLLHNILFGIYLMDLISITNLFG